MDFSTKDALGHAKGLGSAHEGTRHWWHQRVTAIALIPLTLWFVSSLIPLLGEEREVIIAWLGHPLPAVFLGALMLFGLYHGSLGIQVIIEDYIHCEWRKLTMIWAVRFLSAILGGLSSVSILIMVFIHFTGTN